MPVTKHNFLVKSPAMLPEIMRKAFLIARSGRPGPVLVDIPKDVQTGLLDFCPTVPQRDNVRLLVDDTIILVEKAASAIRSAKRPVIVIGGGVVRGGAAEEARQVAEKYRLPVVSTLMGLGAFSAFHPQYLGLTGMHGNKSANSAVAGADLIIAVGSRFNDRVTGDLESYQADKTIIHIDVDPSEVGKNVKTAIGLIGEFKQLLMLLREAGEPGETEEWWQEIAIWRQNFAVSYNAERLTAPWLMRHISDNTIGQPVMFVTDVGQHQMWAAQHLQVAEPGSWITSGGLGAMGFGLPAAMGAQVGRPDSRAILFVGDGGFKMTAMELYTIASHDLPIIVIIINNRCLGLVRQWQQLFFNKRYSASLLPRELDFVGHARALGVAACRATTPDEFTKAFAEAWIKRQPRVIIADVAVDDLVSPMISPGAALDQYVDIG
jgi:acetolactate synthase I/II/III large subunit